MYASLKSQLESKEEYNRGIGSKVGWQEILIKFFIYNMTNLIFNQILIEIVKSIFDYRFMLKNLYLQYKIRKEGWNSIYLT